MVLRSLLRHPPQWNHDASADCVYVCENPSIVALAADHLAAASQPLICTEGQPSTAVRLLLQELSRLGVRLYYHGDFDWPGIRIANQMVQQFNALPWRMAAADYRHATMHASLPLTGSPVEALWDSDLCQAMMTTKLAVHEEQVVEILLRDLETVTKTHDATKRSTTPTDRTR
jgi:uncharacterized protein (TIGR02679 family)